MYSFYIRQAYHQRSANGSGFSDIGRVAPAKLACTNAYTFDKRHSIRDKKLLRVKVAKPQGKLYI
jgi:hypothetical protein